jgi:hypothetical protein
MFDGDLIDTHFCFVGTLILHFGQRFNRVDSDALLGHTIKSWLADTSRLGRTDPNESVKTFACLLFLPLAR